MKQGKYKYHRIDIPLYFGGLHVLIGHNLNDVSTAAGFPEEQIRGRNYDNYDALVFEADKDGLSGYFGLFRPNATPKIIAHESLHLVNYIMRARGIKLDADNDEPQAYLIGWIAEQIHYALTSKKVKAKNTIKLR